MQVQQILLRTVEEDLELSEDEVEDGQTEEEVESSEEDAAVIEEPEPEKGDDTQNVLWIRSSSALQFSCLKTHLLNMLKTCTSFFTAIVSTLLWKTAVLMMTPLDTVIITGIPPATSSNSTMTMRNVRTRKQPGGGHD